MKKIFWSEDINSIVTMGDYLSTNFHMCYDKTKKGLYVLYSDEEYYENAIELGREFVKNMVYMVTVE